MLQFVGSGAYSKRKEDGVHGKTRACARMGTPSGKGPGPTLWAPRNFIYPMDIADLMCEITNGQSNLMPDDIAEVCGNVATLMCAWERNVDFKMFSYEEALATRIRGQSGRAGGQVSTAGVRSGHAGIVSKDPRIVPT
jgi:hypothetical protein